MLWNISHMSNNPDNLYASQSANIISCKMKLLPRFLSTCSLGFVETGCSCCEDLVGVIISYDCCQSARGNPKTLSVKLTDDGMKNAVHWLSLFLHFPFPYPSISTKHLARNRISFTPRKQHVVWPQMRFRAGAVEGDGTREPEQMGVSPGCDKTKTYQCHH